MSHQGHDRHGPHIASPTLLAERFAISHATLQPEPMTRTVRWGPWSGYGHARADEHHSHHG